MTETDRNNVIDWLNQIVTDPKGWSKFYSDSEVQLMAKDALEMLTEQTE